MAASWGLARIGGGLSGIGGRSTAVGMPFRRVYVNLFRLFWEFPRLFRNLAETFQFGEFSRLRNFLGNRESTRGNFFSYNSEEILGVYFY